MNQTEGYQDIFANELEGWRERGARIIDVREPWEYERGHIPGAQNIPLSELEAHLEHLQEPLVIVCASGGRSASAAGFLHASGVSEVANLMGGTAGWIRQGFPVE